jgi:hypothetical protein
VYEGKLCFSQLEENNFLFKKKIENLRTLLLFSLDCCKGKSVTVYAGKLCFSQHEEENVLFSNFFFEKLLNKDTKCS